MNLNDMIDAFGDDVGEIVFTDTVQCDGHKIEVTGTVPENGKPSVTVRLDGVEIVDSMRVLVALSSSLEKVLRAMAEATEGSR